MDVRQYVQIKKVQYMRQYSGTVRADQKGTVHATVQGTVRADQKGTVHATVQWDSTCRSKRYSTCDSTVGQYVQIKKVQYMRQYSGTVHADQKGTVHATVQWDSTCRSKRYSTCDSTARQYMQIKKVQYMRQYVQIKKV